MTTFEDTLQLLRQQLQETLQALKTQLGKLRTGRANISMLDGLRVNYYGTPTPLHQCAQLLVLDARTLAVKPWDRSLIGEIEKALLSSDLGIMPQNDGEFIRLPVPVLTQERRRDLVKQAKQRGEEAKISLRNHRRDANELLKMAEKDKAMSQDDLKKALEKIQHEVNDGTQQIDGILANKEKEIMDI